MVPIDFNVTVSLFSVMPTLSEGKVNGVHGTTDTEFEKSTLPRCVTGVRQRQHTSSQVIKGPQHSQAVSK